MWFCIYFAVTFCLINIYSLYVSWLTWSDKTTSILPQWSIMVMQVSVVITAALQVPAIDVQLFAIDAVQLNHEATRPPAYCPSGASWSCRTVVITATLKMPAVDVQISAIDAEFVERQNHQRTASMEHHGHAGD
jgi:hypothetical protein